MANRPSSSEPPAASGQIGRPTGEPITRRPPISPEVGDVYVAWYADGKGHEQSGHDALAALPTLLAGGSPAIWVDLASPSAEQVEQVGGKLGLHELIIEDVLEGNQRPKVEVTDGLIHLVLFVVDYTDVKLESVEVDIVLGKGFVLTVHDRSWEPRSSHHLRAGAGPLLERGPDHLLWALCDDIVDGYFPLADRFGDLVDDAQDAVVQSADPSSLEQVIALKRQLHEVRRLIAPVREVFNQLTNRELALIDPEELLWFRDVYDHLIRLEDEVDSHRELLSSTLEVYLTQVNNNLSTIMKRLTGVTVILAGIGAVAGIFGMSEAGKAITGQEATGFWLVTAITISIAVAAVGLLRRIGWI